VKDAAREPKVVQYIAAEAARRYGPLEPDLAQKLQRNLRRNLRVTVDRAEIQRQAEHAKEMYAFAASILGRFLSPPKGKYADPSDVDLDGFRAALVRQYPQDPNEVIDTISWYTVHYEYLR
jgi:hypothetical protein